MNKHDILTLSIKVLRQTEKGAMVKDLNDKDVWLPKSQIEIDEANGEIQVPEWLALDKGLV